MNNENEDNCILCEASTDAHHWKEENQELKALCIDLLNAVEEIGYCPYYITKPFLKVMAKHKKVIAQYSLNKGVDYE